jgi:5-methylcytosine-specific restriction endonuclease McrA
LPLKLYQVTDKKRNGGEWTEARFKSFVTSALRAASRRWPPKYKALKEAFAGKKVNAKTGKLAMHYTCAACNKLYVATDVQVDHIKPVVDPKKGFVSWDVYINRMFCEIEDLQVMCKPCHKIKTDQEKLERKKK